MFGVVEFLMVWVAVRISLLTVSESSFATLKMLALGLVVKAPTIVCCGLQHFVQ